MKAKEPKFRDRQLEASASERGDVPPNDQARAIMHSCADAVADGRPVPQELRDWVSTCMHSMAFGALPMAFKSIAKPGRPRTHPIDGPEVPPESIIVAATVRLFEIAGVSNAAAKRTIESLGGEHFGSDRNIDKAIAAWPFEHLQDSDGGSQGEIAELKRWAQFGGTWKKLVDRETPLSRLSPEAVGAVEAFRKQFL